ncbi:MAG: nuclear transport factor 2 family protein [Pseudomonadota bacterium]
MSVVDDVWALERRCWLEGRSYYEAILHPSAVYAFPPPMGIFAGNDFVSSIGEDGPCSDVEMTQRHAVEEGDAVVLAYHGRGVTPGGDRQSHCTSTWLKTHGGWKLAGHHQTPLEA